MCVCVCVCVSITALHGLENWTHTRPNPQLLNQTQKSQPEPILKMIFNPCPTHKTITELTRMEYEPETYKFPVIKIIYWEANSTFPF